MDNFINLQNYGSLGIFAIFLIYDRFKKEKEDRDRQIREEELKKENTNVIKNLTKAVNNSSLVVLNLTDQLVPSHKDNRVANKIRSEINQNYDEDLDKN